MGQVNMESYIIDTYQGVPYTAAVQVDLVEKDNNPAKLTVWFPLFQSSTPAPVLLDQLKTLSITSVSAAVALDEYSKLDFGVLTVCDVRAVYLTTLKPYGMVSKIVTNMNTVGRKTHDLIALCDFIDMERGIPVTIPAYIKAVSIKDSESATVEAAISGEADQAITQARIAPYAGLILVMTMNNPKGIFRKLGAGTQVIVELGPYVQAESLGKICKTWNHQRTRYVLKSR